MEQWYALHTKPNTEHLVANLMTESGVEVYLPELETRDATGFKPKPFFPCYLFIKTDFKVIGLSTVKWTPGLRSIVSVDDRPISVPEEIINLIRHKLNSVNSTPQLPAHGFEPGDTVRIKDGIFNEMLGIFEGPTSASERVQVLLRVLGTCRVQVEVAHLEKVSGDETETEPTRAVPKRPRRSRGRGRRIKQPIQWPA